MAPHEPNQGDGVLIVTPTYNERENLEPFLADVFEALPKVHILVVDDASPDGTGDLAEERSKTDARVHLMRRPGKLGMGSAYLDGFRWALERDYDVIFEMDTDLSHDARYLPEFLQRMDEGADVVIGSRNIPGGGVEGWGIGRHLLSKGGSLYSRTILGLSVRDLTSGYKAFHRRVLEAIPLDRVRSEGYSFQIELTFRALQKGFTVRETPIIFVDRRAGESKMSRAIFSEAIAVVWKLRADSVLGKL